MNRELLEKLASLERRIGALERQERPAPVVAVYTTDAGQSIANSSVTVVNFEDAVVDTHSAVTVGAGWQFEAPLAGNYLVSAVITFDRSATWAENESARIEAYVGGSFRALLDYRVGLDGGVGSQYMVVSGAAAISLSAGDLVDVRARQTSGGTLSLQTTAANNHISIYRIS